MEKAKVFLSDPQVLFREGIHFILSGEDDFEVVGETTSNEDALTHIMANPPNIAVLSMHNGNNPTHQTQYALGGSDFNHGKGR
jgi:DNA-binding NarL/FixJ family response regulator